MKAFSLTVGKASTEPTGEPGVSSLQLFFGRIAKGRIPFFFSSSDRSGIAHHYSVGRVSKVSFSISPTQWPHAPHPSSSPHCRANQGPCLRTLCSEGPVSGPAESSFLCHNSQGEALKSPNVQHGFKFQSCHLVAPQSSILFCKMGWYYLSHRTVL